MKGFRKRILSIALITVFIGQVMFPMLLGIEVKAEEAITESQSQYGKQGSNIKLQYTSDGTFIFNGTGDMLDVQDTVANMETWGNEDINKNEIKKVIIGEGITSIGIKLFYNCTNLIQVVIPSTVKSIGEKAFYNCTSLSTINVSENISNIGFNAFGNCPLLQNKIISTGNIGFHSQIHGTFLADGGVLLLNGEGEMCNFQESALTEWGTGEIGRAYIQKVIVGNGITKIGDRAFLECTSLSEVQIANSVTILGDKAFYGCNTLSRLFMNDESISTLGIDCFKGCTALGQTALYCGSIGVVPNSITARYILNSQTMRIDGTGRMCEFNNEETWGYSAVQRKDIKRVEFSDGITNVGKNAFYNCVNLEYANTQGAKEIGEYAYYNCSKLRRAATTEDLSDIKDKAFYGCSKMTAFPSSMVNVQNIGSCAFVNCELLQKTILLSSIKTIGDHAFYGCENINSIKLSKDLEIIGEFAFLSCSNLNEIKVNTENQNFMDNEGVLYNKTMSDLIRYPSKKQETRYIIPLGVKKIEGGAFDDCDNLTDVFIPNSVTEIGNCAFENCNSGIKIYYNDTNIKDLKNQMFNDQVLIEDNYGPSISFDYGLDGVPKDAVKEKEIVFTVKDTNTEIAKKRVKWVKEGEIEPKEEKDFNLMIPDTLLNNKTITLTGKEMTGEYYLYVYARDLIGNETIKRSEKILFDNSVENININYSITDKTREKVKVTISSSEEIKPITGWILSEDKKQLTKEYTDNSTENLIIKDLLDNEANVTIDINNIDKIVPQISNINYDIKEDEVIVSIKFNEEIQGLEGWELTENQTKLSKKYVINTKEKIIIKDIAGNEIEYEVNINDLIKKPQYSKGDVDQNGNIDVNDVILLKRHILATLSETKQEWILAEDKYELADMDDSGNVNVTDLILVKREILKNINS